ncbi:virion core protein, T7 gp14 family [Endozoicomonas ascidiicola]|uniref:virion core protein, T7 gp14 family n=1 Tax=Endozoicomonas ascidiicola TaxID=1698521 RepID=UPI0008310F60|nr:hypothetical protein [Endozoicomonas ascidiicola]
MCDPVSIAVASMAMAGGSAIASHQAQSNQAKVQDALYEQNKVNSYASMRNQYLGIQNRQSQEMEAASQQVQQRTLQAMEDQATANVAAGEAGVSGFSVERVLQDMGASASRDISTIEQNRDWTMSQLTEEAKGIATQTQSRINGVSQGVKPSPWATAFQLGGAAVNSYGLKNQLES